MLAAASWVAPRIKLVTTVADDIRIVPQFLAYYRARGVSEFLFNVSDRSGDGRIVERCRAMLEDYPHQITHVRRGFQSWPEQASMIRDTIRNHCDPNDWVLLPDVDELHEYPEPLDGYLAECDRRGVNLVTGEFLDRISRTGELGELCESTPLSQQFPMGCRLSINVLGVPRLRTVAVKGYLPIEKHFCTETDPFVQRALAVGLVQPATPAAVVVHHFKWHSRVKARIHERSKNYLARYVSGDSRFALHKESDRLMEYLAERGGRIDLDDPRLELKAISDRAASNSNG